MIFIDGLHLAEQVYRDIKNALAVLKPNGFIILHDCNPPTEYLSREDCYFKFSPAKWSWNGSTWKGYYAARRNLAITGTCINSDWGVGVLSKKEMFTPLKGDGNPFFEYRIMADNREEMLNLTSFDNFKTLIEKAT